MFTLVNRVYSSDSLQFLLRQTTENFSLSYQSDLQKEEHSRVEMSSSNSEATNTRSRKTVAKVSLNNIIYVRTDYFNKKNAEHKYTD